MEIVNLDEGVALKEKIDLLTNGLAVLNGTDNFRVILFDIDEANPVQLDVTGVTLQALDAAPEDQFELLCQNFIADLKALIAAEISETETELEDLECE